MALRFLLFLLLLTAGKPCFANMASPYIAGSRTATAFTSKDIAILSETLHIRIDSAFQQAKFTVEYILQSDVAGRQIPLLFLAQDFADSFAVWVDGRRVAVQAIPAQYTQFAGTPYEAFSRAKDSETDYLSEDQVHVAWEKSYGSLYRLRDLKYFQTDLPKGTHKIRVTYTARPWINLSGWIQKTEFRYSLSPAKYWRSFGTLEVTVAQESTPQPLKIKFSGPAESWTAPAKSWTFRQLPADFISVSHTPGVSETAAFFITLEPFGLSLILGLLMFGLHLWGTRAYRKTHLQKKYSPVVIWGSLLLPFLWLFAFITTYYFIDWLIGDAAGGRHGYVFLAVFMYPVIMPFYWIVMWVADRFWKGKYGKNSPTPHAFP